MKLFVINLKRSYDIIAYTQKVVKLYYQYNGLVPKSSANKVIIESEE